jgi:diguanylate cyclase (GGDEF)-like protein
MCAETLKRDPRTSDAVLVERSNIRPSTPSEAVPAVGLDVHATAALDRLTRWAAKALRAPVALVSLASGDGDVVTGSSRRGVPVDPATAPLCARVITTGKPLAIGNAGVPTHDGAPVAFVGAPLVDSTGNVIGCLCVTDTRPRNWSEHDTELVKELAISATTELELRTARAMAEREMRWSEGQQEVLELIAARAPLPETLTRLLHVAESHAPGMLTSILLLERTADGAAVLRHAAGPSLPDTFTTAVDGLAVADGQGICGTAAHRREPVIVLDVSEDPLTTAFVELARAHGLRAGWSTPILSSDGEVLGTFALYYGPDRPPKPSDEIVIDRSIHLARLAIEQSNDAIALRRSATHARSLAREQTALQRVATSVAEETDPEVLFDLVAEQVGQLLKAECGYVLRFSDGERYRVMGSWGRADARVLASGGVAAHAPDGLCVQLRRTQGERRRSADANGNDFELPNRIEATIVVDAKPWGMIVALRGRPGAFPPADEQRLARFAQLASVAVANAHARERLATQALTDPLTGVANRRAFDQRLAEETERALRHGRALSVMLVDVDHFKAINDRFGHAAGDHVLQNLADDLQTVTRQGDLLARVGGDEMAMILADCPPDQAADVARRMLSVLEDDDSLARRHEVTLSVGVAGLAPGQSADDLLRRADQALYRAKGEGRNQVVSYEERAALGATPPPRA